MINSNEVLGIIASFIILVSLTTDNEKLRIWNTIGSILYVIYGIRIHAFSVCFMNSACVVVNLYKIYRSKKNNL